MVALLVATVVTGFQAAPSHAQAVCAGRAEILESLEEMYAEMPRAVGLTCLVAAGEAWERLPALAADRPA